MMDNSFFDQDNQFYLKTDEFFKRWSGLALTYDDVSLATGYSEVLPKEAQVETELSTGLKLSIPILSADMDTVTESTMAIAMALSGGLGLIHYNMSEQDQIRAVQRVKHFVNGLIQDPITVTPDTCIADIIAKIEQKAYGFNTFPVVDSYNRLVGLLPGYALRERYKAKKAGDLMIPRAQVHTLLETELKPDPIRVADQYFQKNWQAAKLIVVNGDDQLRGLFTRSDVERILEESQARVKPCRDTHFRLACGAAVAIPRKTDGELDANSLVNHVGLLVQHGLDAVALSTAHGHTQSVGLALSILKTQFPTLTLIAGNVTSAEGVAFLAQKGAHAIKIGQGPGSICTTRTVAGVGIPQLTALYMAHQAAKKLNVRLIADGGITKSGDIVKALTLADAVICGGLLAGSPEAPGQIIEIEGKRYKPYRGMGSLEAMKAGSATRYGHSLKDKFKKAAPEGIEALKEVAEPVHLTLNRLVGGLQAGMGYLGARTLAELKTRARYVRISPSGLRESHPHDVIQIKSSLKD